LDSTLAIANLILPLAYLVVTAAYGYHFFAGHRAAERLAPPLLRVTLALHLAYLVLLAARWNQFPAATLSQAASAVAFAVAVVYSFVEWHGRSRATGFWLTSMAFLFELLSALTRTAKAPDLEIFHNPLFAVHVSLGLLGYAGFVVGASYGFLFLRLYRELKRGSFSLFFGKLPPLEVLERMMLGALVAGFVALTGAVVSGGVWAEQLYAGDWQHDPKIIATLLTWAFYGGVLLLRRLRRWQGRQMAVASLAGFAAVLFSMVAVNLFFTELHVFT